MSTIQYSLMTNEETIGGALLTQHLLLLLRWCGSQHGGRQRFLTLHMYSSLNKNTQILNAKYTYWHTKV